jgi:Gpi18-like mannosyltransferase
MLNVLKSFSKDKKIWFSFAIVFFLLIIAIPDTGPGGYDRTICWTSWANYIFCNGLENIYKLNDVDYLPLYHYVLWFFGKIQGSTENIISNINDLKYITIVFEFISILVLYQFIKHNYKTSFKAYFACLIVLLNPAFLYNSMLYGQLDGIVATFLFVSFIYGIQKRITLSLIFYIIALNFKLQAVMFGPFLLLLLLPEVIRTFSFKNLVKWAAPAVILQLAILVPFFITGGMTALLFIVKASMGKYPWVTMGAYNVWFLFLDNPRIINDKQGVFGRSFNKYGLFLYIVFMFMALLPMIKDVIKILKNKIQSSSISKEKVILIAAIIPTVFFFFNTQMHSRYIHTAILMLGTYALLKKTYLAYILISLGYFINIEGEMKIIKGNILPYKYFFFEPKFVAALYLVGLIIMLYELFFKKQSEPDFTV